MGEVLSRETLEHLTDVDVSKYSTTVWIHDPNMVAVTGVDVKYWKLTGDVVSEMSPEEKDAVDSAEAAAVAAAANTVKVFRYVAASELALWGDSHEPPIGLDYGTGLTQRLERKLIMVKGEVRRVEYYAGASVEPNGSRTYTDLIIEEDHNYTRDAAGFALSRTVSIGWVLEDETVHATRKDLLKVYSTTESIREGKRRRSNVIDELQITVAGMLIATEVSVPPTDPNFMSQVQAALDLGRGFIAANQGVITAFIEGSIRTVHDVTVPAYAASSIVNAPTPWMDNVVAAGPVTVRDVVLSTLDIWS